MQQLLIRRIGPRTFQLEQEFNSECGIRVPWGFISDGISLPIYLRWIVAPTGSGFNAAVVHDWLLKEEHTWEDAAERFEAQLVHDEVSYLRRKMYVAGVKLWGVLHGKQ